MHELVEAFTAAHPVKTDKARVRRRNRIVECVDYFTGGGITQPSKADYEQLRKHLLARPLSASTANDYVGAVKKFCEWLNEQSGGQVQLPFEQDKEDGMMPENEHEETLGVKQEVAMSGEYVGVAGEVDTPKKRGRKPNPENADRVQVSIYLQRELYENIKDYAAFNNSNISDITAGLIREFVSGNLSKINEVRNFLQKLNFR